MPTMKKLTVEEFEAPIEKTDTKPRTIRYYGNENIPGSLEGLFSVALENVIVVPPIYLETVIEILRGNNPQRKRYAYKTYPRTNDVVIGVQYAYPN